MVASPDGHGAWVAGLTQVALVRDDRVVAAETPVADPDIPYKGNIAALAVSPSSQTVYVTVQIVNRIVALDAATLLPIAQIVLPNGWCQLDVAVSGGRVWFVAGCDENRLRIGSVDTDLAGPITFGPPGWYSELLLKPLAKRADFPQHRPSRVNPQTDHPMSPNSVAGSMSSGWRSGWCPAHPTCSSIGSHAK